MAGEAHLTTVGDYVSLIRGTTYKGNLVGKAGPALLGLGSIEPGGGFRIDSYKTYGGNCPPELMLFPGDIYASLKGATKDGKMIGSVARVPPSIPLGRLTQDTVKLVFRRPDPDDASYLHWVLRSPQYRDYCAGHATGSAVVALSRRDFLSYPVPPSTVQRKNLVALLDEIDEKIELNRKMSATLEAIARALFKSWFVDFDPVRAKAEGRDSGLPAEIATLFPDSFEETAHGQIPSGWGVDSLKNAIRIFDSKRIPLSGRERATRTGPYPYYGAASVMDHIDDFIFSGVHLLIGEDGSVIRDDGTPVLQYIWGDFWVNNHAHVVVGDGAVSTEQIYMFLQQTNIRPYVTGAVQPKLNQGNLFRVPFLRAPDSILSCFAEIVSPLFERIRLSFDESLTLAALRDALLPKLISGELRVGDAERVLAASA